MNKHHASHNYHELHEISLPDGKALMATTTAEEFNFCLLHLRDRLNHKFYVPDYSVINHVSSYEML